MRSVRRKELPRHLPRMICTCLLVGAASHVKVLLATASSAQADLNSLRRSEHSRVLHAVHTGTLIPQLNPARFSCAR